MVAILMLVAVAVVVVLMVIRPVVVAVLLVTRGIPRRPMTGLRDVSEPIQDWRAMDLVHRMERIIPMVASHRSGLLSQGGIFRVAVGRLRFWGGAGGRDAESRPARAVRAEALGQARARARAQVHPDDPIHRVDVTLLQSVRVQGRHLLGLDHSRHRGEEEGPESREPLAGVAVVLVKHVLEVLVRFYRHEGIEVLRRELVLQDHVPFKQGAQLLHQFCIHRNSTKTKTNKNQQGTLVLPAARRAWGENVTHQRRGCCGGRRRRGSPRRRT